MPGAHDDVRSSLSALVDELGVAVAIYDRDASELHRSRTLASMLAGELRPHAVLSAARALASWALATRNVAAPTREAALSLGTRVTDGASGPYRLRALRVPASMRAGGAALLVEFERAGPSLPTEDELMARCRLTRREVEITLLLAGGASDVEIAGHLELSPHTVRKHTEHIFDKLHVHSRHALVARLATMVWAPGETHAQR